MLRLQPYMKFKLDFIQARLDLKGFADNLPVGDSDNGITGHNGSFFQRSLECLSDTFGLSAGLMPRKPGWQRFYGIALKHELAPGTAQFDDFDRLLADIDTDETMACCRKKSGHFCFP